jgi:energy-converting hydrogenase Eha subunit C
MMQLVIAQRAPTHSQEITDMSYVLTITQVINSGFVPLLAAQVYMTSFLDLFKAGLLIDDISFILILYAFFNQFYYLVDPM